MRLFSCIILISEDSATSSHAAFPFLAGSDARFELQHVVFNTSTRGLWRGISLNQTMLVELK